MWKQKSKKKTKKTSGKSKIKKSQSLASYNLGDLSPYDLRFAAFAAQCHSRFIVCGGDNDNETQFFEIIPSKQNVKVNILENDQKYSNANLNKIGFKNGSNCTVFTTNFDKYLLIIDRYLGYNVYDLTKNKWLLHGDDDDNENEYKQKSNANKPKMDIDLNLKLNNLDINKSLMRTLLVNDQLLIVSNHNSLVFYNFVNIIEPKYLTSVEYNKIGIKQLGENVGYLFHGFCLLEFENIDYEYVNQLVKNCYKLKLLLFGGTGQKQSFNQTFVEIDVIFSQNYEKLLDIKGKKLKQPKDISSTDVKSTTTQEKINNVRLYGSASALKKIIMKAILVILVISHLLIVMVIMLL